MVESRHMKPFCSEISLDQFFVVDYKINPSFLSDDHVLSFITTCNVHQSICSLVTCMYPTNASAVVIQDGKSLQETILLQPNLTSSRENSLVHLVEIECWSAPFRSSVGYFKISIGILKNCFSIKHTPSVSK